jgi:hypothetical protein
MLARAGCSNVEALNVDFLTTDASDEKYAHVTHMYARSVHACQLCLTHLTKIVSLIRPAVVLGSSTASTTSWNLVRFCRLYSLRTGGSLRSLISPPRHRQEAEGSSATHAERLTKLATFQLQMLRHAMKCMSHVFVFLFCFTQLSCQF